MRAGKDEKMSSFYSRDSFYENPLGRGSSNPKIGSKLSELREGRSGKETFNRAKESYVSSTDSAEKVVFSSSETATKFAHNSTTVPGSRFSLPKNLNMAENFQPNAGATEEISFQRKGLKRNLETMRNQIINYSKSKSNNEKFRKELLSYFNDTDTSGAVQSTLKRDICSPSTSERVHLTTNNIWRDAVLENRVQPQVTEENVPHVNETKNVPSQEKLFETDISSSENDLNCSVPKNIQSDIEKEKNAESQSELIAENLVESQSKKNVCSREKTPNDSEDGGNHSNLKRMKRSEIPVPKYRLKFSKQLKSSLPSTQKAIQKTEALHHIQLYPRKTCFSSINESMATSRRDEKVTEESRTGFVKDTAEDSFKYKKQKMTFETEFLKENSELENKKTIDVKLGKEEVKKERGQDIAQNPLENSIVPVVSVHSWQDNSEKSGTSKAKTLDLGMTKSSLILKTSSITLHRLESLHQQNVLIKEGSFIDRNVGRTWSKLTPLTSKSSYNSLKGTKKNFLARSSSKANKSALNCKAKKPKKESEFHFSSVPLRSSMPNRKSPQRSAKRESDVEGKTFADSILDALIEKISNSKRKEGSSLATMPQKLSHEETLGMKANFVATKQSDRQQRIWDKPSMGRIILETGKDSDPKRATMKVETRDTRQEEIKLREEPEFEPLDFIRVSLAENNEAEFAKHYLSLEAETDDQVDDAISLGKVKAICENALTNSEKVVTSDSEVNKNAIDLRSSFEAAEVAANKLIDRFIKKSRIPNVKQKPDFKEKALMKKFENENITVKGEKVKTPNKEDLVVRGKSLNPSAGEFVSPVKTKKPKFKIKIDMDSSESLMCLQDIQSDFDLVKEDSDSVNELSEHWKTPKGYTHANQREEIEKRFAFVEGTGKANPRANTPKNDISLTTPVTDADKNKQNEKGWLSAYDHLAKALRGTKTRIGDPKARSGLSKHLQEVNRTHDQMDLFDEASLLKLKRRNSEPNSCRGFICRYPDLRSHRYNNTSVSSLASSLKHLHADELEDFIFWEAIPPMMTSCWEMSLYHFKKPWSMLSCSVFKDNRLSETPGLILENLRSGGTLYQRQSLPWNRKGKAGYARTDSFDVEPSIAQKDIDIKNWLAALNFPTHSSTSTNLATEGNFPTQIPSMASVTLKKVLPKRRKGLPVPKFSIEMKKKQLEEPKKPDLSEPGLKNLVQKKSGGFVVSNQCVNSEFLIEREKTPKESKQKTTSRKKEDSPKIRKRNPSPEVKGRKSKSNSPKASGKKKTGEKKPEPKVILLHDGEAEKSDAPEKFAKSHPEKEENLPSAPLAKSFKRLRICRPNINIWKYLFISTIVIIMINHLVFANNFCIFSTLWDYVP